MLGHAAFTASRLTGSLAAIRLDAPTVVVGLLLSLYSVAPMLLSISMGRWIDRTGTRMPMLIGAVTMGLGLLAPALLLSVPALCVNSVLVGLGFIVFHMCIQKMTGELAEGAERVRNFGLLAVALSISGFSGPIVAGFIIDHAGEGASFAAAFGVSSLMVGAALVLLKWRWRFDARPVSVTPGAVGGRTLDLLRTPLMRRIFIAVTLLAAAWDVHMFLVPIQGSRIGLSASQIGMVLGAFSAATFVVRLAMPVFARRLSEWQMVGGAQAIAALVYFTFPMVGSHYGLMGLAFVLGLGIGLGHPAVMAMVQGATPPGRTGEAVGLRMMVANASQTFLPLLFGSAGSVLSTFLSGSMTFAPLFWGVAILLGLGGISALRRAPAG
ncbi:MAG TPA: MFS transporter [Quisquiliibacterium sp.]|nr:MFS transporter [Quisquiliibacterium sp.]